MIGSSHASLPGTLALERDGEVAILTLKRAHKRNALDLRTVVAIGGFFAEPPPWARSVVVAADGDHFCAGLDLSDLDGRDAASGVAQSRIWHQAFTSLQRGRLPVVAALRGAVIGGGLELASAAHIRVAEDGTFFALPEGRHGIFVGGGGSVRISSIIGVARMTDMMLTGRVLGADEAERIGLVSYVTGPGGAIDKAVELAMAICENSELANYAIIQALPRIGSMSSDEGLFVEALMAGIAQSTEDAKGRLADFLAGRGARLSRK